MKLTYLPIDDNHNANATDDQRRVVRCRLSIR